VAKARVAARVAAASAAAELESRRRSRVAGTFTTMNLDLPELRNTARGQACTLNVPGVCNYDPATTVWCHANTLSAGKGMRLKASDPAGCFGCSACHHWLDFGPAPFDVKLATFCAALIKTYCALFGQGLLRVVAGGTAEVCKHVVLRPRSRPKGNTQKPAKVIKHPGVPV